jgi:hypothetical protein
MQSTTSMKRLLGSRRPRLGPCTCQYAVHVDWKETDLEELLHKRALGLHLRLEQDAHNMRLLFQTVNNNPLIEVEADLHPAVHRLLILLSTLENKTFNGPVIRYMSIRFE